MSVKKKKAIITLTLDNAGEFSIVGPMNDPVLFLGMLEMARQRYFAKMTNREVAFEVQKQLQAFGLRMKAEVEMRKSQIVDIAGERFKKAGGEAD